MEDSGVIRPFASALFFLCVLPAAASDLERSVSPFLEKHCVACHDDDVSKGGLNLSELVEAGIAGDRAIHQWTRLFDRVHDGEMPPKKEPRPEAGEVAAFLAAVTPALASADAASREVVLRRLNRIEYENTIRDLFGIDVDLIDLLPEDQSSGGFDNNGKALAISAELVERYLEAARRTLDEVIRTGARPEKKTFTVDSLHEVERYLGKQYALIDGRVTTYMTERTEYSKISTRAQRLPERGRYRFRFTAAAVHADEPVTFSVTASNFQSVSAVYRNLGYFEAGKVPTDFEIEATLDKGFAIQFFAHGLPLYVKDPTVGEHPGIGWSEVEVTGPIHETWPPAAHSALIGGVDLEKGNLADAETILRRFLPRAYRRPVSEAEVSRPLRLVENGLSEGRTFAASLRVGLEAVLCSPGFLFLREDSSDGKISGHEIASRLSYFLWSSMPDEGLLSLAEKGTLSDPEVLAAEVGRLLGDPKSERFVRNFTGQWLHLRRIDETTPDAKLYPDFDDFLEVSMVDEAQSFFAKILRDDLAIANFIDSDFIMLNRRLARHYGIEGVSGHSMEPVALPADSVRGGVMTQAAVLKVTANGTNTSPVMRGLWVLENLLGKHVPPPPPNTAGIEPDIREATTIREQLDLHSNAESCTGCHQYIDPPGFALESFDPVGGYREQYLQFKVNAEHADKGWGTVIKAKPVDPSGELATGEAFASIVEFKALLLADEARFAQCLTDRLATYALGRELGFSDRDEIAAIVGAAGGGGGLRTLIRELVLSPLFSRP